MKLATFILITLDFFSGTYNYSLNLSRRI